MSTEGFLSSFLCLFFSLGTHKSFTSPETMGSTCCCLACTPGPLSSVSCCHGRRHVVLILGLMCEPQPRHCQGSASPLSCRSSVFNLPAGGLDETILGHASHSFNTYWSVCPVPSTVLGVCDRYVKITKITLLLEFHWLLDNLQVPLFWSEGPFPQAREIYSSA